MKLRISWLVIGLSISLLALGALRAVTTQSSSLESLGSLVTVGYITVVVGFTIALLRSGLPLNRLGFGMRLSLRHLGLALLAVVILRVMAVTIDPIWEALFSGPRDLDRFSDVEGSVGSLAALLVASWTIAAFGEELTYRIVLMRGISFVLGDTKTAMCIALVLQSVLFGLIHAYQGPTGIVSSGTHGLVFGAITLAARWSIWPAALAHGINNTIGILSLYQG